MSRREVSPLEGEPESVVTNEEIGLEKTCPVLQGSSSEVDSLLALDKVPGDIIQVFEVSVPRLFPLPLFIDYFFRFKFLKKKKDYLQLMMPRR